MSETHELDKARHAFRKFLQDLHAWQPTCTGLFERDRDVEPFVEVERSGALDCFLRKYPTYERFRDELAEVRRGEQTFFFIQKLWKKACEE
jgi:hypothetical protein